MRSRTAAISAAAALVTGCWLTSSALAGAQPTPEPSPEPAESAEPAAEPAQPLTAIEADGSYAVGTELVPGTYSSAGPVEGEVCYWKRVSSGEDGDILENAMTKKPQVVQISATDGTFVTSGCQPWQQTTDPAADGLELPPAVDGLLGKAKLRHYIDTLNRNAQQFGQVPPP